MSPQLFSRATKLRTGDTNSPFNREPQTTSPMKIISESFSVDSALLKELGERLVTTPHVALAELVKNSYDADATEVKVTIRENAYGGPEIEVSDNGSGMDLQQIKDYWMRIGNTHKGSEQKSKRFGRPLSGNKGIGRFCVRRLGTHVRVESSAKIERGYQYNILEIDWTKFTPGTDVGGVQVTGSTSRTLSGNTGLKLTMNGHRIIEWRHLEDKRSYNYLLRQLATLTANTGTKRKGYEPDPGFRVILDAPSLQFGHDVAGILDDGQGTFAIDMRERLMNAGWALLKAHITKDGHIHTEIQANAPVGNQTHDSGIKFKHLKSVSLTLAIFVEETGWNRDETLVPLGKLNEILNEWGGIQLRHKGMRVFPYGDSGDDWLEIDKDRGRRFGRAPDELQDFVETLRSRTPDLDPGRVLLNSLSAKAYLGGVEIDEKQEGLEQRADRQGFVGNSTFAELQHFARYCVNWAMIWRDFAVRERERAKIDKFRNELERRQGGKKIPTSDQGDFALRVIRSGIQQLRKDPSAITDEQVKGLMSAAGLLEAEFKATRSDLVRFQLVASAATLSLLYHHEVQFLASTLDSLAAELSEAVITLKGNLKNRCSEVLEALTTSKDSLDALADLTQDMGILDRKAQATSHDLAMNVERAIARFKRVCETYKIEITTRIDEALLVGPMLKGELAAILLNVLSNAIKAVIAGGNQKAIIEMHGYRSGAKIFLDIKDNGIGLSTEERTSVFMPLVSDPSARLYDALEERLDQSERQLLGQGSGLGLSIVRGVLDRHDGSCDFIQPTAGWSTCLRLQFKTPL